MSIVHERTYSDATLFIAVIQEIKGIVPSEFIVQNIPYRGDCVATALNLVGKKFLCFLTSDTLPTDLYQLGVANIDCDGLQGIFVTDARIVTFRSKEAGVNSFIVESIYTDLNRFLEEIIVSILHQPLNRSIPIVAEGKNAYLTNGRILRHISTRASNAKSIQINSNRKSIKIN